MIAQGIEKGIAEYKKQQSRKSRERDKERKQQVKLKNKELELTKEDITEERSNILPWGLLGLSWLGFIGYILLN